MELMAVLFFDKPMKHVNIVFGGKDRMFES
jgi:hypothetical protein